MKKDKKGFDWSALADGLGELIVVGIAFLIGAVIIGLLGYSIDSPSMDGDLIILIGLAALALPFVLVGIVAFCIKRIKKSNRKKKKEQDLSNE